MQPSTGKSGKCSNFGNCSLADARATIDVPSGLDFVCHECGKPLLMADGGGRAGSSKTLVITLVLLSLLVAGGAFAWFTKSKGSDDSGITVAAPPPVAQPENSAPVKQPSGPLTGTCSEADEKAGLCRVNR